MSDFSSWKPSKEHYAALHPCPVCGYQQFSQEYGTYEICQICFWEDDWVQLGFPDSGGANRVTLIEGQKNFIHHGACQLDMKDAVRPPSEIDVRDPLWRPLDLVNDIYLRDGDEADLVLWQKVHFSSDGTTDPCLYYWRPNYWLINGRPVV
jgi:hypothetical protein